MIETEWKRDIRKYKSNFMGGLSLRQIVTFLIAALVAFFVYNIQKKWTDTPNTLFCTVAAIPLLFGFNIQGMTFENYLKSTFISNFVAPKTRIYKTENPYREFTSNDPIDELVPEEVAGKEESDNTGKKNNKKTAKAKKVDYELLNKKAAKESAEFRAF